MHLSTQRMHIPIFGRTWIIEREADLESLWESISKDEFGDDERIPYWCEVWPASLCMGQWLHKVKERINGRLCLDMGCGLGLNTLIAAELGAKAVGMDYEPIALYFARRNAENNSIAACSWIATDWRSPGLKEHCFDFIWGSDIMYEQRFIEPASEFVQRYAAQDGILWTADPGRNTFASFIERMAELGWASRVVQTSATEPATHKGPDITVEIREFRRRSSLP